MIFLECAGPIWWRDGGLGLLHIAGNKGAYGLLNIECRISDALCRFGSLLKIMKLSNKFYTAVLDSNRCRCLT